LASDEKTKDTEKRLVTKPLTIQINQPTRCSNLSGLLLVVYVQLNMFRASSCPSSGATTTAVAASGFWFTVGAW
jgi:hypothetical protein